MMARTVLLVLALLAALSALIPATQGMFGPTGWLAVWAVLITLSWLVP